MVAIWVQVKLIIKYKFQRSMLYRIYSRFNFSVSMKPASIKARYKTVPWKVYFKKAKLYIPANTKKLYFYWFNVRMFYTPPTKTFIAPSLIYQKYFPEYDVLATEDRINAWKLINGYYFTRWYLEFYWYRFRFMRMKEKNAGWQRLGLYPHWLSDRSLQRRPIRHTYLPDWDLLRVLHAMDLLLVELPKKEKWAETLKKRIEKNIRFNIKVIDRFTFILHMLFFYPWRLGHHLYTKYIAYMLGNALYYIIYIIKFGRRVWRNTAYHRINWFKRFIARSMGVIITWYLPWYALSYIVGFGQENLVRDSREYMNVHAHNDFRHRLDFEEMEDRYEELLIWVSEEIALWAGSTTIVFICIQFVMSFSPRLWAYVLAFSDWIGAIAVFSISTMCLAFCTAMWDVDVVYETMPWGACMFLTLGYWRWHEDFAMFFDPETDQVLLWYDQLGSNLDNIIVDKHLKQLYKNPDWKMTGLVEYPMMAGRTISEDERHLSTHIHSFKKLSRGYLYATWRKQHRYLLFFAERFIEYKNLKNIEPADFLYQWMKGAYEYWDQELDNPSNKYEWEFFGEQDTTNTSSFTEERRDYWDENFGEFWQYIIGNATLDVATTTELVENNEFYHVKSPVDGMSLGSAEILFKLFGNNDRDMFHCMYYEPFALQQAVLNQELLKVWENDDIIATKLWTKHAIMREYLSRGFAEGSKLGSSPEQTNKNYSFWNEYIITFREDLLDERVPILGKAFDSFAVKPGIMIYNSKTFQIYNFGMKEHWKPNSLIKFKYDRRRPISTALRTKQVESHNHDWDNWTDSQFYYYSIRKTAVKLITFYTQFVDAVKIGWMAFTFKNIATRDWVLKELIVLKYINYINPLEKLYKQYSYTYSAKDLGVAVKIWSTYQNLLTTFEVVYSYFNKQEQYKLTNDEWIRHMQNWDDLFYRHAAKSGIEESWLLFQKNDQAWQALTKEKNLTELVAGRYEIFQYEVEIITRQLRNGSISQAHFDLIKGSLFVKMEILAKRTTQLVALQDENEQYRNWTKHFSIEIKEKIELWNRYNFIKLEMEPLSVEADLLFWKPLPYTMKEVFTRIFSFRTLAQIRADNVAKAAKKAEAKKAALERRLANQDAKETAYSTWKNIRIEVKKWRMSAEDREKLENVPEVLFGRDDDERHSELKPDKEDQSYKPYKIKDESEKMFKNRDIERKKDKNKEEANKNIKE